MLAQSSQCKLMSHTHHTHQTFVLDSCTWSQYMDNYQGHGLLQSHARLIHLKLIWNIRHPSLLSLSPRLSPALFLSVLSLLSLSFSLAFSLISRFPVSGWRADDLSPFQLDWRPFHSLVLGRFGAVMEWAVVVIVKPVEDHFKCQFEIGRASCRERV